ncbi:hypothetical protein BZK42_12080 [Citrobacter braakii]|uniref:Uncharacterized protein n=2 Tax=Citrobacter braakii TaxID=57706 RepID=A0A1V8P0Q4_CITBR|nr:hypothetical protein BZK42_12080 [Citrobacter braakii]
MNKHETEKRRMWCKLRLAAGTDTHEIVSGDLILNNITNTQAWLGFMSQTYRRIRRYWQTQPVMFAIETTA